MGKNVERKNTLLDLITANDYPYINTYLSKQEFFELEEFIKDNCFIINKYEKENKWEYEIEYEFLYKAKPILLKRFKSYTNNEEYFLLRCEK